MSFSSIVEQGAEKNTEMNIMYNLLSTDNQTHRGDPSCHGVVMRALSIWSLVEMTEAIYFSYQPKVAFNPRHQGNLFSLSSVSKGTVYVPLLVAGDKPVIISETRKNVLVRIVVNFGLIVTEAI